MASILAERISYRQIVPLTPRGTVTVAVLLSFAPLEPIHDHMTRDVFRTLLRCVMENCPRATVVPLRFGQQVVHRAIDRSWKRQRTDDGGERSRVTAKRTAHWNARVEKCLLSERRPLEIDERRLCCICMDRERRVFLSCNHLCLCLPCACKVIKCPLCKNQATPRAEAA